MMARTNTKIQGQTFIGQSGKVKKTELEWRVKVQFQISEWDASLGFQDFRY